MTTIALPPEETFELVDTPAEPVLTSRKCAACGQSLAAIASAPTLASSGETTAPSAPAASDGGTDASTPTTAPTPTMSVILTPDTSSHLATQRCPAT